MALAAVEIMTDLGTQCTVGIIGGGALAEAIAIRMVAAGITVLLCDTGSEQGMSAFPATLGALARPGSLAEVIEPEIVVLALPWCDVAEVLAEVQDWDGRILVDATNPPSGNGLDPALQGAAGSSQVVAGLSVGAQVVKCFNTLTPIFWPSPRSKAAPAGSCS
jgi:8-hydroxy-5-deazaflavin:NADPH oxidoreductase